MSDDYFSVPPHDGGNDNLNGNSNDGLNEKPPKLKPNKSGLIIFILIICAAIVIAVFSIVGVKRGVPTTPSDSIPRGVITASAKKNAPKISSDYIAVVRISGVIQSKNKDYDQTWLLDTIKKLRDDRRNLGILLDINSPGGSVYESDEVYLALRDYAEKKKLRAYLGPLAASGGYYIACAADYITANRNTLTGSIGVIAGQALDLTALMDKYGVKVTTITAGSNKNMLNFNSPLTTEQRAIMQSIADECYAQFVEIVAKARRMDVQAVRRLADGRIYTAKQALNATLIDEIAAFDDALNASLKDAADPENPDKHIESATYEYTPKQTFSDFMFSKSRAAQQSASAETASAIAPLVRDVASALLPNIEYPAYYYRTN